MNQPTPPPISPELPDAHREAMLAALPRIGTSPITSKEAFVHRLEDLAFELGDLREEAVAQKRDDWWRLADVLDDVMDMLDALKHRAHNL